ncbi:MAG: D-alanyl-D-alanine carboxypeptidase, partial [Polaromonas sp.]|nr:D-alanyl-D-alanine carboxypeptidase [Polaromonas sp.]
MLVNPHPARLLLAIALVLLPGLALAQKAPAAARSAKSVLPAAVAKALTRAQVPPDAVTLLVVDASGKAPPRLAHRAAEAMNPASVMKLVTTYAALDLLGPDYTWNTRVLMDGSISDSVLRGNLIVRGGGDPKMVVERLQALLAQIQYSGVKVVRGDIVLDRSAFQAGAQDAGEFDGEPLRPYNASPDALLINFKSMVMRFTPDPLNNRALVAVEPPLAGIMIDDSVPLTRVARCGDWRSELRASVDNPNRLQFSGSYSAACGERVWPSAYAEPSSFAARAIEGSWRALGGLLTGTVRDATAAELALLRALGASKRQVVRSVQLEAFVLGVIGATIGLGLGVLLAMGLRVLFAQFGLDLSGQPMVFGARTVLASYLVGVLVTMAAAWLPARRTAKISPVQAMRDDIALSESSMTTRFWRGLALAVVGMVLLAIGLGDIIDDVPYSGQMIGAGVLFILLGVAAMSPVISRPFLAGARSLFARL